LGNLNASENIYKAWENIKENTTNSGKESLGLHKLKQNKPWFEEECLRFLDQKKKSLMQWLQDPNQTNVYHLSNVRRESSRHFRNTKRTNLKSKLMNLNQEDQKYQRLLNGKNVFKKGYQSRTTIVKNEKGDFVTDSHSILARWRKHFSQLLNVHRLMM